MAESTDKKTRKIAEKRVEKGKEFEGYQEAQNQLLAIQAEQQQNLALQANDAMNVQQQNQTLAQAAEVMAMDNLNPATQEILAGYGLNQPRVIKQSNTQRQGPNNITINNTTINNASGPVQGREVSIKPQEAEQSKFRAWLTNVFARQDAQWQKQNQEYAKRESSLTRNSNKMMRKLEGLGKEIGNAVDPRKITNNVSNPLMNLLKSIGLVALAKRLPKILHFIDNAETTIKGWFSGIGDKIKSGLSGIFKDLNIKEIAQDFLQGLYNDSETGKLNILLKDIEQWLEDRIEMSDRAVDRMDWNEEIGPGGAIRRLITWLSTFVGGDKYALRLEENDIKDDIVDRINDERSSLVNYSNKDEIGLLQGYGALLRSNTRYGLSTESGQELNDKTVTDAFDQYLYSKYKYPYSKPFSERQKIFKDWVKGQKDEWIYTGESIILTYKAYNDFKHHLFIPETYPDGDLNQFGRIPGDNIYSQLVVSWEIIMEAYRGGTKLDTGGLENISYIENIIYLLKLLLDHANLFGDVIVFPQLIKLLGVNENEPGVKPVTICLVKEPFAGSDRKRYVSDKDQQLSRYYKKIIRYSKLGDRQRLPIAGEDFNGRKGMKVWSVYSITADCIGNKLEAITGKKDIDYTYDYQHELGHHINITANSIWRGGKKHVSTYITHDDYEEVYSDIEAREKEREYQRELRSLENSREEAKEFLSSKNTDFVIEEHHEEDSKYSLPIVNMSDEEGLRLGTSPDPVTGEKGPVNVRNVTNAFGGDGTLTSNYKERREYDITSTNRKIAENGKEYRLHRGIDLNNKIHGEVKFPAHGKIKSTSYIGKDFNKGDSHVDIEDDDGYVTIFRHTKLADRFIDDQGKPIPAEVFPGEVIGETEGYKFGPHIHVEVKDPKGKFVNPLKYFKPILNNLKNEYQPEEVTLSTPEGNPDSQVESLAQERELISEFSNQVNTEIKKLSPEYALSTSNTSLSQPINKPEMKIQGGNGTEMSSTELNKLLETLVEQVSLITQSTDYTARSLSPLVDNMNSGFSMVAQSSKSTPAKTRANTLNTENEGIV